VALADLGRSPVEFALRNDAGRNGSTSNEREHFLLSSSGVAFRLNPDRGVRGELRRALVKQLRAAEERVPVGSKRAVHDARMRIKKARAVLTLLEHAKTENLDKDRRRLRRAARALAGLRDLEVAVTTYDGLRSTTPGLAAKKKSKVRRQLVNARDHMHGTRHRDRRLKDSAAWLRKVQRSAESWDIPPLSVADLARLLMTGYRAARRDFMTAARSPCGSAMHEWRKSVKTLWYQLQFLGPVMPAERHRIVQLTELQTCLGQHQDLEMLQLALAEGDHVRKDQNRKYGGPEVQRTVAAATRQQARLRAKALTLGGRVFADAPATFGRDLRRALLKTGTSSTSRDARSAVA
jgi:CHAD domain-containing protein